MITNPVVYISNRTVYIQFILQDTQKKKYKYVLYSTKNLKLIIYLLFKITIIQLEEDEREWFSDEEDKSEAKKSLVDYENSDSEPETEKDQKATVIATESNEPVPNDSASEGNNGVNDVASVSEGTEKKDDASTPNLGEKREPMEDGNDENPKRLKITTEVK